MSDLVIETTGCARSSAPGGSPRSSPSTASTWPSRPAACTASSAPTARARPPRSGCCSAWPAPPRARCGSSASRCRAQLPAGHRPGRRRRRGAQVHARLHRPQEPHPARPHRSACPPRAVDAALEQVGLTGRDRGPLQGLLARHEAAAGDRRHAAQEPRPADPRRADQRPRPGRHPRHPRHDPRPRRVRRHRAAQLAHPGRGAAGLPLGLDHRRRPAARLRPRSRTCSARERLAHPRRGRRPAAAASHFLETAGYRVDPRRRPAGRRGRTDRAEQITRVLADRGIYVRELTPIRADLESVFLQLTRTPRLTAARPRPTDPATDGGAA